MYYHNIKAYYVFVNLSESIKSKYHPKTSLMKTVVNTLFVCESVFRKEFVPAAFWNLKFCSLEEDYSPTGGTYCVHHQDRSVSQKKKNKELPDSLLSRKKYRSFMTYIRKCITERVLVWYNWLWYYTEELFSRDEMTNRRYSYSLPDYNS
jgi:hypothetical protein